MKNVYFFYSSVSRPYVSYDIGHTILNVITSTTNAKVCVLQWYYILFPLKHIHACTCTFQDVI